MMKRLTFMVLMLVVIMASAVQAQAAEDVIPLPEMIAFASSNINIDLGPEKAVDGLLTTFWSSFGHEARNVEEWLEVGFTETLTLSGVTLYPRVDGLGFPVDFVIEVSMDGREWDVVPGQNYRGYRNPGSEAQTFEFDENVDANFLRIRATVLSQDDFGIYYFQLVLVEPHVVE